MPERVLIIGGGVSAMRCALELRTQGYEFYAESGSVYEDA